MYYAKRPVSRAAGKWESRRTGEPGRGTATGSRAPHPGSADPSPPEGSAGRGPGFTRRQAEGGGDPRAVVGVGAQEMADLAHLDGLGRGAEVAGEVGHEAGPLVLPQHLPQQAGLLEV